MQVSFFVFDLDGTLVDSRRDIADSANAVLEECGYPPHSEEAIGNMVGGGGSRPHRAGIRSRACARAA
ncbi:MAG: HAD hydrolase-like protein [Vicinamibacterales bacterium]